MPPLPDGFSVRRVPFRTAPDDDIAAVHAVEAEVQPELRTDIPCRPLDRYLAFARSLPSSISEWSWVVSAADGTPVAQAGTWFEEGDDPRTLWVDVQVRRPWRRRGIGSHLVELVCDVAAETGRSRLVGGTLDTVPAGEAFAASLGAGRGRVNRTSELRLANVDWAMVRRWVEEGPQRAPGYTLQFVEGPYPAELRADAVTFNDIMQTAPKDDLDVADSTLTVEQIEEWDRLLVASGSDRGTIFVRAPGGECVGGTSVIVEPWDPGTVHQGDTGIHPDHRGRGLGKWVKAAMLERVRAERPGAERVRTGNAYSNAPMLAINDTLGFKVIYSRTDWQADAEDVRAALG